MLEYPSHERFFIKKAILKNPAYFQLDKAVNDLCWWIWKTTDEGEHLGYVAQIQAESNADKKALVLRQLKEKRDVVTAGPDFENWLVAEEDPNVLLFLRPLLSLKIYDRGRAYARYRILHDKTLWNLWRTGNKYAVG